MERNRVPFLFLFRQADVPLYTLKIVITVHVCENAEKQAFLL